MEPEKCGNCKFKGEDLGNGYFPCKSIPFAEGMDDKEYNTIDYPKVRVKDVVAYTVDGSGYHAALCVSDDFGCNQWEKANG